MLKNNCDSFAGDADARVWSNRGGSAGHDSVSGSQWWVALTRHQTHGNQGAIHHCIGEFLGAESPVSDEQCKHQEDGATLGNREMGDVWISQNRVQ